MRTRRLLPDAAHDALARCDDLRPRLPVDLTRVTLAYSSAKVRASVQAQASQNISCTRAAAASPSVPDDPCAPAPRGIARVTRSRRATAAAPGTGTRPRALAVAVLAPWPEMLGAAASLPGGRRPAVRADGTPSGVGLREWVMATSVAEYKDTTTTRPWRRRALSVDRAPPYAPYAIAPKAVARATRTAHVDRIARTARRARRRAH